MTTANGGQHCRICGTSGRLWLRREGRDLCRCPACGLLWVPQGLLMSAGVSIYEQDPPIFLVDGNTEYYLDESNLSNARLKVAWMKQFTPPGVEVLDMGANFGHFAAAARSLWKVRPVEPSAVAAKWGGEHLGVPIEVGSVYDERPEFEGRFGAVTLWDVIEHVPDPEVALCRLRTYLRPDGLLYLTTPDAGSLVARAMAGHWHYLDLVQHIVLFNRRNLARLLAQTGYRVRAIRSFGRLYRTSYVRERMAYLGRDNAGWRVAAILAAPFVALGPSRIRIDLGDVMGIAAEAI